MSLKNSKRGDLFYYVEVIDRDSKLEFLLGDNDKQHKYLGSKYIDSDRYIRSFITDDITSACFWKDLGSVERAIDTLLKGIENKIYKFVIMSLNRESFIESIKDFNGNKNEDFVWYRNHKLKLKELSYKKKIESIW